MARGAPGFSDFVKNPARNGEKRAGEPNFFLSLFCKKIWPYPLAIV